MGGLATTARTHLQTRHLQTFGEQEKGCIFIGLRFQGWELAIGNVYLESGTGLGARIDPGLLSQLAVFVQELRVPWIIVGDWNCSPEEPCLVRLSQHLIKGRLVAPGQATTTQGSEIDYASDAIVLVPRSRWTGMFLSSSRSNKIQGAQIGRMSPGTTSAPFCARTW